MTQLKKEVEYLGYKFEILIELAQEPDLDNNTYHNVTLIDKETDSVAFSCQIADRRLEQEIETIKSIAESRAKEKKHIYNSEISIHTLNGLGFL